MNMLAERIDSISQIIKLALFGMVLNEFTQVCRWEIPPYPASYHITYGVPQVPRVPLEVRYERKPSPGQIDLN